MTDLDKPKIDKSIPHPARVYDYWLGGKDHFEVDAKVGAQTLAAMPGIAQSVRDNRAFLGRAVRFIAAQGVTQFLDIGTGIPTQNNTHEVAQSVHPDARIVYVDNDPIVMNHARALLRGTSEGATAYLEADLRDPEKILAHPELTATLDLSRPVGVMFIAILMHIKDADDPWSHVRTIMDAMPAGSYLAISHATADLAPKDTIEAAKQAYNKGPSQLTTRTAAEIARFFDGCEILEPGLVSLFEWRPDNPEDALAPRSDVALYAGVGRKP